MTETEKIVNERRKKRAKKHRRNKIKKAILFIICLIVFGLVVFVAAIKFMQPDYDFKALIPNDVATFVDAKVKHETTTTTTQTTTQTTTKPKYFYLEEKEFTFDGGKKGAFVGNLLNGGKVERDGAYIYHVVDGEGIYSFYTTTEEYKRVYNTTDKITCLNVKGENFYYISDYTLYSVNKSSKEKTEIHSGIKFVYIYDNNAYCVTDLNEIAVVDLKTKSQNILYKANAGCDVSFVGISLNGVFFTENQANFTKCLYVDKKTRKTEKFMDEGTASLIKSMSMENGFLYYHKLQADNTYDLVRQKIGSQNVVTLVENTALQLPVVVSKNKVFFADYQSDRFVEKEYNMNSKATKIMINTRPIVETKNVIFQHGGEYDFIIGKNDDGDSIYIASSNLTSSTNVMKFNDGKWKY